MKPYSFLLEAKNYYSGLYGRKAAKNIAIAKKARDAKYPGFDQMFKSNALHDIEAGRKYSTNNSATKLDIKDMKKWGMSKNIRDSRLGKMDPDKIKISNVFRSVG